MLRALWKIDAHLISTLVNKSIILKCSEQHFLFHWEWVYHLPYTFLYTGCVVYMTKNAYVCAFQMRNNYINNKYVKQDNQATSCHSGKCKYTCRVNTGSYIYVCISYIVLMFVLFSFVQLCVRVYVRVMGNSFYISNWDLDMLDEEIRLNSQHVRGYFFSD
mgnify:CR=1 FL=1